MCFLVHRAALAEPRGAGLHHHHRVLACIGAHIVDMAKRRWKWMHKASHGYEASGHLAHKSMAICNDMEFQSDRFPCTLCVGCMDDHNAMLAKLGCYIDYGEHVAFASPTFWRRDSLVKPLFLGGKILAKHLRLFNP